MKPVPSIIEYAVNNDTFREAVVYDEWSGINNMLENQLSSVTIQGNNNLVHDEIIEAIENIDVQSISDNMHTEMENWFESVLKEGGIIREECDVEYGILIFDRLLVDYDCKVKISEFDIVIKYNDTKFTIHSDNASDIANIHERCRGCIIWYIKEHVRNCSTGELMKIQNIIND